tara:strand:+ start:450 stop:2765 length:2316 start_codon:yes stop_codon:yes gene_type:complete
MTNSTTFPGTVTATGFTGDGSELTNLPGFDPAVDSVAIGNGAGAGQGNNSVAIGHDAGTTSQGASAVAIGYLAGTASQGEASIAMGTQAGKTSQGTNSVALGNASAQTNQGNYAVAVGEQSGLNAQGEGAVAIGWQAGYADQGSNSIAIGKRAGSNSQFSDTVAVGVGAGYADQSQYCLAIGTLAGSNSQGYLGTGVGFEAGKISQGSYATALGGSAGKNNQGNFGVAVGYNAGGASQGTSAIAVGQGAGGTSQQLYALAIGSNAGNNSQGAFSIAIGYSTAQTSQGNGAIAIGRQAGRSNQGTFAIAVGYLTASTFNQPANTTWWRYESIKNANGHQYLRVYNTGEIVRVSSVSDDRLKYDEKFITGAVKTLSKLRPQEYLKKPKLIPDPDRDEEWERESGLMAQEVYYSAPELRHLVRVSETAGDIGNYTPPPSDDPAVDPDYSVWGNEASGVEYIQLIPYLIKGIQEIVTELPRSKTTVSNTWGQNVTGLVVSADTNTHKTNIVPIVTLSNVYMDKKWYGVVSDQKTDTNNYDTLIDTKGDTRIWVTDVGGPLESGNLLTTSNVAPGHTQKQVDDLIRSSTVAKVTQDCDFTEPIQHAIRVPKRELSNVKYYVKSITREIELSVYELYNNIHTSVETTPMYIYEVQDEENSNRTRFYSGGVEVGDDTGKEDPTTKYFMEKTPDEYENLDDEEKAKYTLGTRNVYKLYSHTRSSRPIPEHEEEVFVEELVDVLDENEQIVYEDTANTAPAYTLVDHGTHKAALLTCKIV